jgi:2-oxoglutarate ferredoxin oxidoreductase subunit delta
MKYWRKTLDQGRIKSRRYQIHVIKDRCKGCRFCIEFCPRQVLKESPELNSKGYRPVCADDDNACLDCGLCELICPEFALSVVPLDENRGKYD